MENITAPERRIVGIGSVCAEADNTEFVAFALGSCIALCLYEPHSGAGAMAHILLPSPSYTGHGESSAGSNTKYTDRAIDAALEKMRALGAEDKKITAAIIGGAEMFPLGGKKTLNIGEMNTESVTAELKKRHIPIILSETGGKKSRTVFFTIPGCGLENQITIKSPQLLSSGSFLKNIGG